MMRRLIKGLVGGGGTWPVGPVLGNQGSEVGSGCKRMNDGKVLVAAGGCNATCMLRCNGRACALQRRGAEIG